MFEYLALISIATLSIYIGSAMSYFNFEMEKQKSDKESNNYEYIKSQPITLWDASMLPAIGSVVLLSLYTIFIFVNERMFNLLLNIYITIGGMIVPSTQMCGILMKYLPKGFSPLSNKNIVMKIALSITNNQDYLKPAKNEEIENKNSEMIENKNNEVTENKFDEITENKNNEVTENKLDEIIENKFDKVVENKFVKVENKKNESIDIKEEPIKKEFIIDLGWSTIISYLFMGIVSFGYIITNHWILNNIVAVYLSISTISIVRLNSFTTGSLVLTLMFFYDIFWVFKTPVMVAVGNRIVAPVKIVIPYKISDGISRFAILGLGDIILPGMFIALFYRFDRVKNVYLRSKKLISEGKFLFTYFQVLICFYVIGLMGAIISIRIFYKAQPALLYLSPACILSVLGNALYRKEFDMVIQHCEEDADNKPHKE